MMFLGRQIDDWYLRRAAGLVANLSGPLAQNAENRLITVGLEAELTVDQLKQAVREWQSSSAPS